MFYIHVVVVGSLQVVVAYNPLGWVRKDFVRIPVRALVFSELQCRIT